MHSPATNQKYTSLLKFLWCIAKLHVQLHNFRSRLANVIMSTYENCDICSRPNRSTQQQSLITKRLESDILNSNIPKGKT